MVRLKSTEAGADEIQRTPLNPDWLSDSLPKGLHDLQVVTR